MTAATASKTFQPPNPPLWKKALLFPLWLTNCLIFVGSLLWFSKVSIFVADTIHRIINVATFGTFAPALQGWIAPKDNLPRNGFERYLAELLLNRADKDFVHMTSILYLTFMVCVHVGGVLYCRVNNIGGWAVPLLLHMWYMGSGFVVAINDLHYVAHYQVSNNQKSHMFRSELINAFCRYVLEPCQGFIPEFWLNHHVKIHHKESNGPDDIQGVSFFERKFYNFIWFVADLPIQWYIRGPVHHIKNGTTRTAMEMIVGCVVFVAVGIKLTMWDPLSGVLLFWIPHTVRMMCFNAMNEYIQHALVDGRSGQPEAPANNSFLILNPTRGDALALGLKGRPDNFEERWHAVHHNFPHKGMLGQDKIAPSVRCNLVFDTAMTQFKFALFTGDMMTLAKAWRPGYTFEGAKNTKISPFAESDKKLSLEEKAELLKSFLLPAYSLEEMGDWIEKPRFPFNCMELGPMQKVTKQM